MTGALSRLPLADARGSDPSGDREGVVVNSRLDHDTSVQGLLDAGPVDESTLAAGSWRPEDPARAIRTNHGKREAES